jgi:hypothetical protein
MTAATTRPGSLRIARPAVAIAAGAVGPPSPMPLVAVLGPRSHAVASACAVALALARARGAPAALAGAAGVARRQQLVGGMPAARRHAGRLRGRGLPAVASGRVVWVALEAPGYAVAAEARGADAGFRDEVGLAAAIAAGLGRATSAARVPAALALPLARTDALDRVLAWHDAFVVVRDPGAPEGLLRHALASLASLGRPVATMAVPPRVDATLAAAGMRAPAAAVQAVERLGDVGRSRG